MLFDELRRCQSFQFKGESWNSLRFVGSNIESNFIGHKGAIEYFITSKMLLNYPKKIFPAHFSLDEITSVFNSYGYELFTHDDACVISYELELDNMAYCLVMSYLQDNSKQEKPDFTLKKGSRSSGIYLVYSTTTEGIGHGMHTSLTINTSMPFKEIQKKMDFIHEHVRMYGEVEEMKKEADIVVEKLQEYHEFKNKRPST